MGCCGIPQHCGNRWIVEIVELWKSLLLGTELINCFTVSDFWYSIFCKKWGTIFDWDPGIGIAAEPNLKANFELGTHWLLVTSLSEDSDVIPVVSKCRSSHTFSWHNQQRSISNYASEMSATMSSPLFKFLAIIALASGSKFQMADEINVRKISSIFQCAKSIPNASFSTKKSSDKNHSHVIFSL